MDYDRPAKYTDCSCDSQLYCLKHRREISRFNKRSYSSNGILDLIPPTVYTQYPVWLIRPEAKLPGFGIYSNRLPTCDQLEEVAVRRKVQPKDNTGALKMWLLQHKMNPYPTKPEKIMLAILSKMTMTQVSTWFANARRRLKKEFPDEEEIIQVDSLLRNENNTQLYPDSELNII